MFNILEDFLKVRPEKWNYLKGYMEGKQTIKSIKVVNGTAEPTRSQTDGEI